VDEATSHSVNFEAPSRDALFEHIVRSSTDFAIFTITPDGIGTTWNVGAEGVFGFTSDEIVGRNADVIFRPEDRAAGVPEQERAQAFRTGRAEDERWHRRKDGSLFWASGALTPLENAEGFVKIVRDRTPQHLANTALRESEERFRLLATSIPQLVFRTLPDGDRTWGSPQWIEFTGLSLAESLGFGWLSAIHPDDVVATQAAWGEAQANSEYYIEHRVWRKADGEYRWHQTRARPITNIEGEGDEWVGTMTDIHDLRGLKDRQEVLVAELQHRTRNLLAVVQSIATQMLRKSTSLEAFGNEFERRLRALSRVQSLLAEVEYKDIDLHALLEGELAAHGGAALETGRIKVEGPPIPLPAVSAQAIGLAVHELATNALRYGALARDDGELSVTWDLEKEGNQGYLSLQWRESGVTIPEPPRRKGYGTELIVRALPYQLKAKTKLEFREDGVRCLIVVPVRGNGSGTSSA